MPYYLITRAYHTEYSRTIQAYDQEEAEEVVQYLELDIDFHPYTDSPWHLEAKGEAPTEVAELVQIQRCAVDTTRTGVPRKEN